ncbi:hypothetical protein LINPERHAP1_LOCUS12657, partial [Linum perenne]
FFGHSNLLCSPDGHSVCLLLDRSTADDSPTHSMISSHKDTPLSKEEDLLAFDLLD